MLSNIDFGSYFHTKKYEKGLSTGGDKIADWGGSKGGWGGHVPPSLYVKRGPGISHCAPRPMLQLVSSTTHSTPHPPSIISCMSTKEEPDLPYLSFLQQEIANPGIFFNPYITHPYNCLAIANIVDVLPVPGGP